MISVSGAIRAGVSARKPAPDLGQAQVVQITDGRGRRDRQAQRGLFQRAGRGGQRGDRRHEKRRVGPQRYGDLQGASELLRLAVVKPSPLLNLPVHAGALPVEDLHPVHPHVPLPVSRIVRDDLGESEKAPSVAGPAGEHGEGVKIGDPLSRDDGAAFMLLSVAVKPNNSYCCR